jgi:hypothetical protein
MKPRFTKEENIELNRLLGIVSNKNMPPGQRRIAMAKYDKIYGEAVRRMRSGQFNRHHNRPSVLT